MKIDAYSDKREAHVVEEDDRWVLYPEEFALFMETFTFPDLIPIAVPGFVAPDISSDDPHVVVSTWMWAMSEYLSVDAPPYEFEVRGVKESEAEPDDPDDIVY